MLMLSNIPKQELPTKYHSEPIQRCYDTDKLPTIDRAQLVWYNEMHIQQEGGARMWENR